MVIDESLTGFGVRLRTSKPASLRACGHMALINAPMLLMANSADRAQLICLTDPPEVSGKDRHKH